MFNVHKKRHIFNRYASYDGATMPSSVLQYLMMRVYVALRLHCLLHAIDNRKHDKVYLLLLIYLPCGNRANKMTTKDIAATTIIIE